MVTLWPPVLVVDQGGRSWQVPGRVIGAIGVQGWPGLLLGCSKNSNGADLRGYL